MVIAHRQRLSRQNLTFLTALGIGVSGISGEREPEDVGWSGEMDGGRKGGGVVLCS